MCCNVLPVLTSQCLQPPEETALWTKQHLLPHSLREKHGLLVNSTKYAVPHRTLTFILYRTKESLPQLIFTSVST